MNYARHENDRRDTSSSFAEDDSRSGSQSRIGVVEAPPAGAGNTSFDREEKNDDRAGEGDAPVAPREHDQRNRSAGGTSELSSSATNHLSIFELLQLQQQQRENEEIPANLLVRVRENLISSALNTSTGASPPPSSATDSLTRSLHDQFTRNDSSWPLNRQDESAALQRLAIQRILVLNRMERHNQLAQQLTFRGDSHHQGLASHHQVDAERSLTALVTARPREETHASSSSYFSAAGAAGRSTTQQTINSGMEEEGGAAPKQNKHTGVSIIPCRARGMPKEHNFKTAYFQITDEMEHGEGIICSFENCRKAGIKFRYCAECKDAIAKRNFRNGHHHTEIRNPAALLRRIGRNEAEPDGFPTSSSSSVGVCWTGTNPGAVVPQQQQQARDTGAATAPPSITTGRAGGVFPSVASSSSDPRRLLEAQLMVGASGYLPYYSMMHQKRPPRAGDTGEESSPSTSISHRANGATTSSSSHGYDFQSITTTSPGTRRPVSAPGTGLGTHTHSLLPAHDHLPHHRAATPAGGVGAAGLSPSSMGRRSTLGCQKSLSRMRVDDTATTAGLVSRQEREDAEKAAAARSKGSVATTTVIPLLEAAGEPPSMERRRAWNRLLGKRPRAGVEDSADKMSKWISNVIALSDMETPFSDSVDSSSSNNNTSPSDN